MFQIITSQRSRKSIEKLSDHYRRRIIELLLISMKIQFQQNITTSKNSRDTRIHIGLEVGDNEISWDSKKVHELLIK